MRPLALALLAAMTAFGQYFRGVNLAGAEFGENNLPGQVGRDYTYNSAASFWYFSGKGLNLFRIPVRWERLQPQLRGPLDSANLGYLRQNVEWAWAAGGRVIIDIHNYGRYQGSAIDDTAQVSTTDFIDFWVRLSTEFKDEPGVYAYDLMNEPHDMGKGDWKRTSQAVLQAIRDNGDDKLILVPGDSWSSANRWVKTHGLSPWIGDPADNFAYEAHLYFDRDESGQYKDSYDVELARDPNLAEVGRTRLEPFLQWCRDNGVRGYLGEYGVPAEDPRWHAVLDRFLARLDEAGMGGAYWAAGEWWGNYRLSVQPRDGGDRPQLATLQAHLGAAFLTNVSAASAAVLTAAPGSLVSGYSTGMPDGAAIELVRRSGARIAALPLYTSATQVNYMVPEEAATGVVDVVVSSQGRVAAAGILRIERVAPALFPAAQVVGRFLQLYGTGLRQAATVQVEIGGVEARLAYAGPQGEFPGLDQVNAEIPAGLAGEFSVVLIADGKKSNAITISRE